MRLAAVCERQLTTRTRRKLEKRPPPPYTLQDNLGMQRARLHTTQVQEQEKIQENMQGKEKKQEKRSKS